MATNANSQTLRPAFLWESGRFVPGREVVVSGGAIDAVGDAGAGGEWNVALMPGFVNVHSHGFQRGLRGMGETFSDGHGSFFTWREAMYQLVLGLDEDRAYELSTWAFKEMLDAGFTSVGEFHYIHHAPQKPWGLDRAVLAAAHDVGIRIVLLHADYVSGGINQPLGEAQARFDTAEPRAYLDSLEAVTSALHDDLQTAGMVCHSIRAVDPARFKAMREEARRRGMVFHLHLEEVTREIEECRAAHGVGPMRLLLDNGIIDELTTAVHCTHSTAEDLADFGAAGGRICLCPITEGNLGDGIANVPAMREAGCALSIGTDLNSRICPMEELRWLEYVQRINLQVRGVVRNDSALSGPALIDCATRNGAEALGLASGEVAAGKEADFVAFDLAHPTLAGVEAEDLASAIVFGTGNEAIAGTCVGGAWRRGGPEEEN